MRRKDIVFGLLISVILALFFSPFASPWPDGLEKVAESKGFLEKAEVAQVLTSPIPDYVWPSIENERIATSLAGVFGTLIVFMMGYGIAVLLKRREVK